jgi:ABC-2 type transport system ATP-binding protein
MRLEELPLGDQAYNAGADGMRLTVKTANPAKTIADLLKWIDSEGLQLTDIHLKRPTLEDVFIELTGKRLREA